jgi:plastocyanin
MKASITKVAVLLAAVALLGAACSKSGGTGAGSGSSPSSGESEGGKVKIGSDTANDHGTKSVAGKSELEVEADDYYFEPTIIEGQAGQKVTLELENEGKNLHNFSIDSLNIDQDVAIGKKADVTVTIPQSGTLEFFCKYHRSLGMAGELKAA